MQQGDLVGGRWRLVTEAPGEGAVRRWRAVAVDTGEPAEILTLRASATVEARRAFARAHRQLSTARDPALCATERVFDEIPAVLRAPLEDATLADVPGLLPAPVVAAIGARLLPAVLAAGPATQGALLASDVGLDASGRPVLAPRGRPLNAIDRTVLQAVAPETFGGGAPDGASGLYGLGALLYRLATGKEPPGGPPRADRPPPAPPSAVHHAVPPELDRAILKLLSSAPTDRAAALPLLLELAGDLPDLRASLRDRAAIRTTTAHQATPALPVPRPTGPRIVLPHKALAPMDPAARSLAAGYAGVPVSAVDALAAEGLPLVIAHVDGIGAARRRSVELARETGLPLVPITGRSLAAPVIAATAGLVVGGLLLVGALLLALGVTSVAIVGFVLAGIVAAAGAWAWGRTSAFDALAADSRRSADRAAELVADLDPDGVLGPSWRQLARVRRALAGSELPAPAAADLRGALKDVERRLLGMAEVGRTSARALVGVDVERMRTRLAALERATRPDADLLRERDRLTRALADLDEVERRRRALADEAREIDATLEEIGAALARATAADEGGTEKALDQLVRTTALARRAAREEA